jgi:hypothetical protein
VFCSFVNNRIPAVAINGTLSLLAAAGHGDVSLKKEKKEKRKEKNQKTY